MRTDNRLYPLQGDAEDQALPPEDEVVMLCYQVPYIPGNCYYEKARIINFDGSIVWWFEDNNDGIIDLVIPIAWKRLPKLVKYEPAETQPDAPKTSGTIIAPLYTGVLP